MNADERADYARHLAERRSTPARPNPADAASRDHLADMVALVEKAGATAVLVIPPTLSSSYFQPPPDLAARCLMLDFSDVEKFAALFAPEHRYDQEHVNVAGSKLYTEALAQRFLEEARGR